MYLSGSVEYRRQRNKRRRQAKRFTNRVDRQGVSMGEAEAALMSYTLGQARVPCPIARDSLLRDCSHVEVLPMGLRVVFNQSHGIIVLDLNIEEDFARKVKPERWGWIRDVDAEAYIQWWAFRDTPEFDKFVEFLTNLERRIESYV